MAELPYRAISFMASAARLGVKYGLKSGVARASAKANPVLLVLEAAWSVAECVKSFIDLETARQGRDGLLMELTGLTEELRIGREKLISQLDLAKEQLEARRDVSESIQQIVQLTQSVFSMATREYAGLMTQDLPDLEGVDSAKDELEEAWSHMRMALRQYQTVNVGKNSDD